MLITERLRAEAVKIDKGRRAQKERAAVPDDPAR
jgi:hypothetical protein